MNYDSKQLSISLQRRTADVIYDKLRDEILANQIKPGSKLSVPNLAERFGVSRSPIREAVQKLVLQGLADEEIHRGAIVIEPDPLSVIRLYELREVLEELAAKLAAEKASAEELESLEIILDKHERAIKETNFSAHLRLDQQFHEIIRTAARNEHLFESLERVQDKVTIAMLTAGTDWPQHALQEHRELLNALRNRSPEDAALAAKTHISRLRKSLIMQIEKPRKELPQSIAERLSNTTDTSTTKMSNREDKKGF